MGDQKLNIINWKETAMTVKWNETLEKGGK
jgi:hypothetical protein